MAYALAILSRERASQGAAFKITSIRSAAEYDAWGTISQFLQLHDNLTDSARKALLGRMQGAFSNPADMRALQFEWLIGVHLLNRGFEIAFPEQERTATFDVLARRSGTEAELECKSASSDKGLQITRRESIDVQMLLLKELASLVKGLNGGLLVRVIVPKKLPKSPNDRRALCQRVKECVLTGHSSESADLEVRLQDFALDADAPFMTKDIDQNQVQQWAEKRFGIANRHIMVLFNPGRRVLLLTLESRTDDDTIGKLFDTIKDAAERQLSRTRAGIVCVKLEGLVEADIEELAQEQGPPSALRFATSRFLDARRQSHLICLGFFADGPVQRKSGSAVSRAGSSYLFENPESRFFNRDVGDAFRGMRR